MVILLKVFFYCLVLITFITTACYFKNKSTNKQLILDSYQWFNQISSERRIPFTEEDVGKYFSKDAKMITNGKIVCMGLKEHYDHFVELSNHFTYLRIDVNKIDMRHARDRIYLNYTIEGKNKKNEIIKILIMGYMIIKNKHISVFNEIALIER